MCSMSGVPEEPSGCPTPPLDMATTTLVDYAVPFMRHMFLIIVDTHSKWMDVHLTKSAQSQMTIEKMRHTFATFGLPEQLVTDNGSSFTGVEFGQFMQNNRIRYITTTPYHLASNGLAERVVQTFKVTMKKQTEGTLEMQLSMFLFHYRSTPHAPQLASPQPS